MNEIHIEGHFSIPAGDNFKLLPCKGIEINEVKIYLESIYNFSFKEMNIRHVLDQSEDYLTIDKAKILNMKDYIKFIDEFKASKYGQLLIH